MFIFFAGLCIQLTCVKTFPRFFMNQARDVKISGVNLQNGYAEIVSSGATGTLYEGEGGAALIYGGNVVFSNVIFSNNGAQYHGGAGR